MTAAERQGLTEQEKAALKAERAERMRQAEDRRAARTERRRKDRQFYGVLLIAAFVFMTVGVVVAQVLWRG